MTDQSPQPTLDQALAQTGPVLVQPDAGSRLEDLHSRYAVVKATADAANEQLKAIVDAIKLELTQAAPDQPRIELTGPAGAPLRLTYTATWRLDSRKLKAEDPELYVRYAKQSGTWVLKAVGGVE